MGLRVPSISGSVQPWTRPPAAGGEPLGRSRLPTTFTRAPHTTSGIRGVLARGTVTDFTVELASEPGGGVTVRAIPTFVSLGRVVREKEPSSRVSTRSLRYCPPPPTVPDRNTEALDTGCRSGPRTRPWTRTGSP